MRIADDVPDIIMLVEVIPKAQTIPIDQARLYLPGFTAHFNFDPSLPNLGSSGCRGIAIFISNSISAYEVQYPELFHEQLWLSIPLIGNDSLTVGCVYRSPSSDISTSTTLLNELLRSVSSSCTHLLVCGDFNYPSIDWTTGYGRTSEPCAQQFLDTLQDLFLYQHIDLPTRYRQSQVSNTLDLVITNEEHMIDHFSLLPGLALSDHSCIQFTYTCYTRVSENNISRYNIHRVDYVKLKNLISSIDWKDAIGDLSSLDAWDYFSNMFNSFLSETVPKTTTKHKSNNIYITREAKSLKNKRNHLWRKYTRTRSQSDYLAYTSTRNALRILTRNLRRNFERGIANKVKQNPKVFWNYVKSRVKTRANIGSVEGNDGQLHHTDSTKADAFNKYFCSVFVDEDSSTVPTFTTCRDDLPSLSSVQITPSIVFEKLQSLKCNKSPGPDGWPPIIFKNCADQLCIPLAMLFAKSLDSGLLPNDWKIGHITPIFKKGSKVKVNNYRPVCLTSVIIKLLESIIKDALLSHLFDSNLLSENQHGFIPHRSCCTQLLSALDDWTSALDQRLPTDVVYFDFSKAFDSVPHNRLLSKLRGYGVCGKLLEWFKCFLVGRHQRVNINGSLSSWTRVNSGVPQGSVLGPLLFALYVNELPSLVSSSLLMFADDIKLYRIIRSPEDCLQLQRDIDILEQWSKQWLLSFNVIKCKVLHIGNPVANCNYQYTLCGVLLETVEDTRDLGIYIDSKLKFHVQTDFTTNKANRVLGLISKVFECKDSDVVLKLYKSLVRPLLEYNNTIWGPHYIMDQRKTEAVQRRATRMITTCSDMSYIDRLHHLNLPSLQYRRLRGDLLLLYQIINNHYNINTENLLTFSNTTTRGHTMKLFKPHTNCLSRSSFFSVRVINDWNSLPQTVIESNSPNQFKNLLDRHYSNIMYDFNV